MIKRRQRGAGLKELAMPTYSQGPHLLNGAIVAIDPAAIGRSTIVFQDKLKPLKRLLEPQLSGSRPLFDPLKRRMP